MNSEYWCTVNRHNKYFYLYVQEISVSAFCKIRRGNKQIGVLGDKTMIRNLAYMWCNLQLNWREVLRVGIPEALSGHSQRNALNLVKFL